MSATRATIPAIVAPELAIREEADDEELLEPVPAELEVELEVLLLVVLETVPPLASEAKPTWEPEFALEYL
jgi:hypothetical protein